MDIEFSQFASRCTFPCLLLLLVLARLLRYFQNQIRKRSLGLNFHHFYALFWTFYKRDCFNQLVGLLYIEKGFFAEESHIDVIFTRDFILVRHPLFLPVVKNNLMIELLLSKLDLNYRERSLTNLAKIVFVNHVRLT